MPNATWSTTDKWSGITLSGGNLTATYSSQGGVRATDKQISGKYYFEITATNFSGSTTAVGIATSTQGVTGTDGPTNVNARTVVAVTNAVYIDGVTQGNLLGAISNGTLICVAVDLDNKFLWFRLGAAGNWNGNAGYNPATPSGGLSIAHFTTAYAAYPYAFLQASGATITANFGDSAFTGTVPSGFTSGWPTGTTSPTNAVLTQEALEQWTNNGDAQITQLALEHWTQPNNTNVQAIITQLAVEHWTSIGEAQTDLQRAMILA